jgi:hypothetical protein
MQPTMPHLAQTGHRLGPAEGLLDTFAEEIGYPESRVVQPSIAERHPPFLPYGITMRKFDHPFSVPC